MTYPTGFAGPCHHVYPVSGSDKLLIFFGAKDLGPHRFNFPILGREIAHNRIFVNNGANHWYQYGVPGLGESFDETVDSLKRWRDAMGAKQIYTIGTSMGGYAAIQYGGALAAKILAFSTDARLNGRYSRSARYFTGTGEPSCADLCEYVAANRPDATLIAGERDAVDIEAAYRLKEAGGIHAISLVGCAHHVPSYLSRRARLGPILRAFVADRDIGFQPDAGRALVAGNYASEVFAAYHAFEEKRLEDAEALTRRALESYPGGEAAELLRGRILTGLGRIAEARDVLLSACIGQTGDAETMTLLASLLRKQGAISRAKQLCQQVIEGDPGFHKAHYGLGLAYQAEGNAALAARHFAAARRIAPRNKKYRNKLARARKMIGAGP